VSARKGCIALMGSGELTSTMVEVHKELLRKLQGSPRAVFLDTPAGFQLNVDDLAQRAVRYFLDRVGHAIRVASFKSKTAHSAYHTEKAYSTLRDADYILIGPGSPTYAVSQWQKNPIPEIMIQRIQRGACLVAASAAALTVGRFTLPVYEIYKVGQDLHWVEGLDLLEHFALPLVIIPHWNNAEGGTHDTRFCYMGEPRFLRLESLLPVEVAILGLDEHTACILDLETRQASVKGLGRVTLRHHGREIIFEHGESFSLDVLGGGDTQEDLWRERDHETTAPPETASQPEGTFWRQVQAAEALFENGMKGGRPEKLVSALLELDGVIWKGQQDLEDPEFIAQARERFRELIVHLGSAMEGSPTDKSECLAPLVESVLRLRERYRREKQWMDADLLRQSLSEAGVSVEDTPEGARWKLQKDDD
jgi:peptidase E